MCRRPLTLSCRLRHVSPGRYFRSTLVIRWCITANQQHSKTLWYHASKHAWIQADFRERLLRPQLHLFVGGGSYVSVLDYSYSYTSSSWRGLFQSFVIVNARSLFPDTSPFLDEHGERNCKVVFSTGSCKTCVDKVICFASVQYHVLLLMHMGHPHSENRCFFRDCRSSDSFLLEDTFSSAFLSVLFIRLVLSSQDQVFQAQLCCSKSAAGDDIVERLF